MNCNECVESLVAYLEGLLDPEQVQRLRGHLKVCRACRAECTAFAQLRERLIQAGQAGGSLNEDQKL